MFVVDLALTLFGYCVSSDLRQSDHIKRLPLWFANSLQILVDICGIRELHRHMQILEGFLVPTYLYEDIFFRKML